MNCKEFLERLDACLDGELSPGERDAFLLHAQECSACERELRCATSICDALAHMNDDLRVPLSTQAAWRTAVRGEASRKKRRVVMRALSSVAAAFVLLAGTTAMFRSTGVLDFGINPAAVEEVHAPAPAALKQVYSAQDSEVAATPRSAFIATDGAMADETLAPATFAAPEAAQPLPQELAWERVFVRSAVREMHSDNFDTTRQAIADLAEEYNATLITDALLDEGSARRATLAVDVPTEDFDAFLEALDFIGEVTYFENNRADISQNYYDARGRLESLTLEKERLNALIPEAATAEELKALESQLTDTYAKIDALEGKLRGYSGQLDYSRVDIALNEGTPLSATVIGAGGARQGFARSLGALGSFFADMGVSLAVIAPYAGVGIALIALIWAGAALVARRRRHD